MSYLPLSLSFIFSSSSTILLFSFLNSFIPSTQFYYINSTQSQLKPQLILAKGFGDGLIQAAAYLGLENALKRCSRLAEAVDDRCACSVFNYIKVLLVFVSPKRLSLISHFRYSRARIIGQDIDLRKLAQISKLTLSTSFFAVSWIFRRLPHQLLSCDKMFAKVMNSHTKLNDL